MVSNGLKFEHADRKLIDSGLIYKKDGLIFQCQNINISNIEIVDCVLIIQYNETKDCSSIYNCCDCGGNNCGCGYCFSCNACEFCLRNLNLQNN